jgi:diguanylate cyclase (GGDEF)-like protein
MVNFHASAAPASKPPVVAVSPVFFLRRLWWAAILLLGLSGSAVVWTIWQLRTDAIDAAIAETGNIATVLAAQLSRSLEGIDAVLLEINSSTKNRNVDTVESFQAAFGSHEFQETLTTRLANLPQVFNFAIADKNGRIVVSTAGWPAPIPDVTERDYFLRARDQRDDQLSSSIPSNNRINGKQRIIFARRLEDSKGGFAGIVFASVYTNYFEDIYSAIRSVHSLIFTLINPEGIILFRYPDNQDFTGKPLSNKAAWLDTISKGDVGFRVFGQADGNARFVSIRKVPKYPLFVDIFLTESKSLAIWWQRAGTIGLGSSILLMLSIYLLGSVTRQLRSLSNSKASLALKSQQLDAALNNMSQGVSMFDGQQHLIVCNTQLAKIYGLKPEQLKSGMPLQAVLDARAAVGSVPDDVENFVAKSLTHVSQHGLSHSIYTLRDGRSVSVTVQGMRDGGWVSIRQDITEQKRIEAQLERMARYDALTGLANRTLLMEKAHEALARMRRRGDGLAVLMLDLDRFKTVNDSLGHPAGDALLKEVARRLQTITRDVDCVARLGGDEFAVLQASEEDQKQGVIALCDRILKAITEPYDLDGRKITLETSIGIAFAPQDGTDADALIKNADLALYKAKAEGRNRYCFFEASMETQARERRELEDDMRKAIARHEFELHYQPIIDLEKQQCCGAEALVRWRHPERGLIAPDQFIPLAEESKLIVPLGEWILRQACADAVHWPSHLKVAVNLSPSQVKQGELLDLLRSTFEDTGLPPQRLELEITESVLLEKNAENLDGLRAIKNLGVSIVLDDFGIGYSSMTYLQSFPFDRIKIDQPFIRNMTDQAAGAAIVSAIAGLGRSLDIATTGEGVETVEQLTLLRAAGCRYAQGFLFGRPVPVSELSFDLPVLRYNAQAA